MITKYIISFTIVLFTVALVSYYNYFNVCHTSIIYGIVKVFHRQTFVLYSMFQIIDLVIIFQMLVLVFCHTHWKIGRHL